MEPVPGANYSCLPLEIRETITQYLDIESLIALGENDPQLFYKPQIFTNRLKYTILKKTFSRDEPRLCAASKYVTMDFMTGAGPGPYLSKTEYEAIFEYNRNIITKLLDLVSAMCSANPLLRGDLHLQLAMFVMHSFPPYTKPLGSYRYGPATDSNNSCSLCDSEQPVNITFIYKGIGEHCNLSKVCNTTLDGWNLLTYYGARVEFRSCTGIPHPIERILPQATNHPIYKYIYPKVRGHELVYKCIMSGVEIEQIYSNVKRSYATTNPLILPRDPVIDIETVILYSFEGAMAFFAALEDPRIFLTFKRVVYDSRQGQKGIIERRPYQIDWEDTEITLSRTTYSPGLVIAGTTWGCYHLNEDLIWEKGSLDDTHAPYNVGEKVIRTLITKEIILPRFLC